MWNKATNVDNFLSFCCVNLNIHSLTEINSNVETSLKRYHTDVLEQAEIQIKYETYIEKEQKLAEKLANIDSVKIKKEFDYFAIPSLSAEAKEKLHKHQPENLGQASRISGITPADISVLMVYLSK